VSCAKCGTRLFAELAEIGMRGLNGYLLPSDVFGPTMHLYCGEAIAPVLDDRPHYRTKPVAFGGDDVLMDWPINAKGPSRQPNGELGHRP
jgi:hypothetical protein